MGLECECGRIARAGRERRLIGAVCIEALDGGLGLGLDPAEPTPTNKAPFAGSMASGRF
jgi:hypothetical protein